jgi:hypothetical protein
MHPIQRQYTRSGSTQTCGLCGVEESWSAATEPALTGDALHRTLHLAHLVKEHLVEVQQSFSASGRAQEIKFSDDEL